MTGAPSQSQGDLGPHSGGARALLAERLPDDFCGLAWLGQAGFALRHENLRMLIDPYLSDFLAVKYAGKEFPHARMMPPPLRAEEIRELDLVLCSHRHGDHMDPGSLGTLAKNNPRCRFVVPKAEIESALQAGLSQSQLLPVDDGDTLDCSGAKIGVIPAAHETLQTNAAGEHRFLGFVVVLGGRTLYHSGDSVVYQGLAERLRLWRVELALLPVNGRSAYLASRGIAGNMSFDEARDLCLGAEIRAMLPHHFGMFDFNSINEDELRRKIADLDAAVLQCVLPRVDRYYEALGPIPQQAFHHLPAPDGGQRIVDLLDGKLVGHEFRRLELPFANPPAERRLGLAFAPARRPLVDQEIEIVRTKRLVHREAGCGDNAIDADRAAHLHQRQAGVDDRLVADRINHGVEGPAHFLLHARQVFFPEDGIGAQLQRTLAFVRQRVDDADPTQAEEPAELDETQSHRSRAVDQDAVAGLQVEIAEAAIDFTPGANQRASSAGMSASTRRWIS